MNITVSAVIGASQDNMNRQGIYAQLPLISFKLNSRFGYRGHPVTGERRSFHKGIDIAAKSEIVCSVLSGRVIKTGYTAIMGNFVAVRHCDYIVYYAHLSKIYCISGQQVPTGYPIGLSGATGRTTGEHLHLTVLHRGVAIDPINFLINIISRTGNDLFQYLLD